MRAVLVVIANIVEEKSPQMAFVHRNNVIQQLSPTAFDPALRHPVLPWCGSPKLWPTLKSTRYGEAVSHCYRVESRGAGAENKAVTDKTFMNLRGPEALKDKLPIPPASKITVLVLGWVEGWVVRSDSRGFGAAGAFWRCVFASIVW